MIRFLTKKSAISHMLSEIRKSNHSLAMLKNFRVITQDKSFVVSKFNLPYGEDGLQFYLKIAKEKQSEVSKDNIGHTSKRYGRGMFSKRD